MAKPKNTSVKINKRRVFLKSSLIAGISAAIIPSFMSFSNEKLRYSLKLSLAAKLFDGEKCWCHARAGIVPGYGENGNPQVVMSMNKLDLVGSDVFRGMYGLHTNNMGESWTEPVKLQNLAPRYEMIDGVKRPVVVSDFWPKWHTSSKTLLGTGHTVAYTPDWKVTNPRPRHTSYSVYDVKKGTWRNWHKLKMPDDDKFFNSGAGSAQRFDLEDGTVLLPISYRPLGKDLSTTVCSCSFDGNLLKYQDHGTELSLGDGEGGLGEPSLTRFNGEFFMTIRNNFKGYVARSKDGLHYDKIQEWRFDDGSELGNYRTQQHWVTHSEGLFLVYTRRGAGNDHVFRNRAPLYIARVDTEKLQVIRNTEQILVPERGARLGNFGLTDVNQNETWVTVTEWMQPEGVEKYGSDGSVFVAKIHWNIPNRLVN